MTQAARAATCKVLVPQQSEARVMTGADLVAVFDAGQGCEKPFFEAALAALQPPAVAVAAAPPACTAQQPAADIFDLVSLAVGLSGAMWGCE
jgi:hypothetical protein